MLRMARARYSAAHNSMQALEGNKGLSDVSASRNIRMFVDGHADGSLWIGPLMQDIAKSLATAALACIRCLSAEVSRVFLVAY
jgi:hypothetical protein